jgi:hypothetical protein
MKRECIRLVAVALLCAPRATLAQTVPSLGAAQGFAVLAGSTVTNMGPTTLTGSLGVSPGSAITGFPPGLVLGATHRADAVALAAQNSLAAAYNALAAQTCTQPLFNGGGTLTAGVYCSSSAVQLFTTTLDAQGNPNAVFIFQIGGNLATESCGIPRPCTSIVLINGASPCNVFWQVAGSATLAPATSFVGNILALSSITLQGGAGLSPSQVVGRLLARNGAVALDSNTASATCATAPPGCPTITLTPSTLPSGTVGVPYRQTLAGTGGTAPVSVSLVSGELPYLTLTLAGLISGTPGSAGTFACTLRGTDAAGCFNDYPYSLAITQAVPTLPEGFVLFLAASLVGLGYLRLRWRRPVKGDPECCTDTAV